MAGFLGDDALATVEQMSGVMAEFLTNVGSLTRIIAPVNLALTPATNLNTTAARTRPAGSSALDTKFEIQTYVARTSANAKGGKS